MKLTCSLMGKIHFSCVAVLCWLLVASQAVPAVAITVAGPAVAVRQFGVTGPHTELGRGIPDMLVTDLVASTEPCTLTVVEWMRRGEVIGEIELQQKSGFDPGSRATPGKLVQPDVFVDGSLTTTGSTISWTIQVTDALTGEVLATDQGNTQGDKIFEAEQEIAKRLAQELCKAKPGYQIDGVMDEATINGTICGGLDKPFTATSPEVAGTWTFTPRDKKGGQFSYTAQNVGGATGSGSGSYQVLEGPGGTKSIKLSGSGAIHSPLGSFSAPITESLTLTPVSSCRRTGSR